MRRAHKVDAVNNELFYFRRFMAPLDMSNPEIARMVEKATGTPNSSPRPSLGCHACQGDIPIDTTPGAEAQVSHIINIIIT